MATTAGTSQSTTGESLTHGQTAESDYSSPGGNLTHGLLLSRAAL